MDLICRHNSLFPEADVSGSVVGSCVVTLPVIDLSRRPFVTVVSLATHPAMLTDVGLRSVLPATMLTAIPAASARVRTPESLLTCGSTRETERSFAIAGIRHTSSTSPRKHVACDRVVVMGTIMS